MALRLEQEHYNSVSEVVCEGHDIFLNEKTQISTFRIVVWVGILDIHPF